MAVNKQQSLTMAARLKDLRVSKGLSHEKLSKALREKYDIRISSDSLMNYEVTEEYHTKAYANQGMRAEYLRCLADFYGVSSDYLLGITDTKSADPNMQAAAVFTGLSEENLKLLNKYVRLREAYMKKDFDSVSIEDSFVIAPHLHTRFVNEMIDASQPGTSLIADYCSLDMQHDFEAMSQLGPGLCHDMIRFKASEVGRAIERHLLERINYGND